jgi:hypothetical protein
MTKIGDGIASGDEGAVILSFYCQVLLNIITILCDRVEPPPMEIRLNFSDTKPSYQQLLTHYQQLFKG